MTPTDPIPVPRELLERLLQDYAAKLDLVSIDEECDHMRRLFSEDAPEIGPMEYSKELKQAKADVDALHAALAAPPPAVTDKEIVDYLIANAYEHKGCDASEDVYLSVKRGGGEVRSAVTAAILKERHDKCFPSP